MTFRSLSPTIRFVNYLSSSVRNHTTSTLATISVVEHVQRLSSLVPCCQQQRHLHLSSLPRNNKYYARNASTSRMVSTMKPGTPINGLDIFKEKDPAVFLERREYPEWVHQLSQPLPSLAKLRKMDEVDATESDKTRYLKLTRRIKIKATNETKKVK